MQWMQFHDCTDSASRRSGPGSEVMGFIGLRASLYMAAALKAFGFRASGFHQPPALFTRYALPSSSLPLFIGFSSYVTLS